MRETPSHTLPAEVHTPSPLSTHVKRPKLYILLDRLFPPVRPSYHRRALAVGLLTVAVAVGLLLWRWSGWGDSPHSGTEGGFHGALLIPSATTEETDTEAIDPAVSAEEGDTESPTHPADPGVTESDTAPDTAPPLPPSSETLPPEPPAESESAPPSSVFPETEPENTTQSPTPETQAPSVNTESPTELTTEPTIEPPSAPPPVPDGCFPIASQDRSEALRGVGYIHNEGATLPAALPTDAPWRVVNPTVLIVNTHPCEGYHDGSPWYDPAQGGLAQTDSPNAPDGVVALGVALTRALRDRGITVIHLRIPITPEESSSSLYDRTQSMIRYYCRLYPDIGLILDLRRSAELTEAGEILRTEGSTDGTPTAQLRITVNGGRDSEALGYDLVTALSLRESLWEESPALSRPVRVKNGKGLVADLSELRVLTLEMGAAGNTYAEAVGLVSPLARALHTILQNFG